MDFNIGPPIRRTEAQNTTSIRMTRFRSSLIGIREVTRAPGINKRINFSGAYSYRAREKKTPEQRDARREGELIKRTILNKAPHETNCKTAQPSSANTDAPKILGVVA
jgi:hypothetical protein